MFGRLSFLLPYRCAPSGCFATLAAIRVARGHAVLINCRKVVTLSQSSHDVRHYLRTCWCRVERNLPIIVYASVSNFLHSYAGHSFTLSRLSSFVVDEHLKLVSSLAFLCHVLAPMRLRLQRHSGNLAKFTAIRRASQHLLPNVAPLLQRHGMSNRRCPPSLLHGVPLLAKLVRNERCPFRQQADCKSSGFLSV